MVMISYTFASLTVPWIAMALSSWRYLAIISCTAVLPILFCYRCVRGVPAIGVIPLQ